MKNTAFTRLFVFALIVLSAAFAFTSCARQQTTSNAEANVNKPNKGGKIRIGFSMDTLKEERWQRDRDLFVKRAEESDAEVFVQSADGSDDTQRRQAESLLTQGVDVLVIIPHNGEVAASIVEAAKRQNVPVISYDRLIRNSEPDFGAGFSAIHSQKA